MTCVWRSRWRRRGKRCFSCESLPGAFARPCTRLGALLSTASLTIPQLTRARPPTAGCSERCTSLRLSAAASFRLRRESFRYALHDGSTSVARPLVESAAPVQATTAHASVASVADTAGTESRSSETTVVDGFVLCIGTPLKRFTRRFHFGRMTCRGLSLFTHVSRNSRVQSPGLLH